METCPYCHHEPHPPRPDCECVACLHLIAEPVELPYRPGCTHCTATVMCDECLWEFMQWWPPGHPHGTTPSR